MSLFHEDLSDARLRLDLHAKLMKVPDECLDRIGGAVADGKDAPAALCLRLHAKFSEKVPHILIVKGVQGAVEKRTVARKILDDLGDGRNIRDIAAPLSRDHHLAAGLLHLLQKEHGSACFRRLGRRHEACRSRADDEDAPRTHRSSARR